MAHKSPSESFSRKNLPISLWLARIQAFMFRGVNGHGIHWCHSIINSLYVLVLYEGVRPSGNEIGIASLKFARAVR